jgi:23S rRNA pseudouridine1911/1915/1917 synthase
MPPIQFLVERFESGQTVAELLRKRYKLTWTRAKRLVEGGHIRVAGQTTRAPEQRVKSGNRFWIAAGVLEIKQAPGHETKAKTTHAKKAAAKPKKKIEAPPPGIELIYSDDAVVVVNKPAGLTTSRSKEDREEFGPGQRFLPKTLEEYLPAVLGTPNKKVFAVHRLDRDTTGLIVFARNSEASRSLQQQFRGRSVERRYVAITRGVPKPGRIETVLVPERGDGRRGSGDAGHVAAKRAVTHVSIRESAHNFALVECKLDTGRTHQIRIHLGEAGVPLCGERLYDRPLKGSPLPDGSSAGRPMLHAYRLGFQHPETEEFVGWELDPPVDFTDCWKAVSTTEDTTRRNDAKPINS